MVAWWPRAGGGRPNHQQGMSDCSPAARRPDRREGRRGDDTRGRHMQRPKRRAKWEIRIWGGNVMAAGGGRPSRRQGRPGCSPAARRPDRREGREGDDTRGGGAAARRLDRGG